MAGNSEVSETQFASQMIYFVHKTGVDIFTDINPNITDLIKNLDRRMVSFLKKREQDFFIPMDKSFRKMIELHTRTFEMLDVLKPGEIGLQKKEGFSIPEPEKPSLKIPENFTKKKEEITPVPNTDIKVEKNQLSNVDNERILDELERSKIERDTYLEQLKFLLDNIKPSKSISGPRFVCNLFQKDIDKIKNLVDGS